MLKRAYSQQKVEIRAVLSELSLQLPHYDDLEWRLDVGVSTRSAHHQAVQPLYLLRLSTSDGKQQILQADPLTLSNMCSQLEAAISQLKASSSRRVIRNIK